MAEWLRRLTRNQIPSGSVGSSPTDGERINLFCELFEEKVKIPSCKKGTTFFIFFPALLLSFQTGICE